MLIISATPIGNLGDVSERLREALERADLVYCEDTRRANVLLTSLGLKKNTKSFFVGNEEKRSVELEADLVSGKVVALISDAGTPSVSDPGVLAVRAARAAGVAVTVVPGPSAVTSAIAASGFPAERFVFEGFLPRRGTKRASRLAAIGRESRTAVLFSSPRRLLDDLADLRVVCDGRELCVARELTKLHEEVWWGGFEAAIANWSLKEPKGEFTLVIEGAGPDVVDYETLAEDVEQAVSEGSSMKDSVREIAQQNDASRSTLYETVLARRCT